MLPGQGTKEGKNLVHFLGLFEELGLRRKGTEFKSQHLVHFCLDFRKALIAKNPLFNNIDDYLINLSSEQGKYLNEVEFMKACYELELNSVYSDNAMKQNLGELGLAMENNPDFVPAYHFDTVVTAMKKYIVFDKAELY